MVYTRYEKWARWRCLDHVPLLDPQGDIPARVPNVGNLAWPVLGAGGPSCLRSCPAAAAGFSAIPGYDLPESRFVGASPWFGGSHPLEMRLRPTSGTKDKKDLSGETGLSCREASGVPARSEKCLADGPFGAVELAFRLVRVEGEKSTPRRVWVSQNN